MRAEKNGIVAAWNPVNMDLIPVNEQEKRIDVSQALKLRLVNGLTYQQIGDMIGASATGVFKSLRKFEHITRDPDTYRAYADNEGTVLQAVEGMLVSELGNTDRLKKASINNVAYAAKQLNDMRTRKNLDTDIGVVVRLSNESGGSDLAIMIRQRNQVK